MIYDPTFFRSLSDRNASFINEFVSEQRSQKTILSLARYAMAAKDRIYNSGQEANLSP